MIIRYHAWIAENIGIKSEEIKVQEGKDFYELIKDMRSENSKKEEIFSKLEKIYISINSNLVQKDSLKNTIVKEEDIIDFFPAISGG